jgi:hypothetical protein
MADQVVLLEQVPGSTGNLTREIAFNGPVTALVRSSTTAGRPTVTTVGTMVYDTTLGKPIWWTGAVWHDGSGASV